MTYINRWQVLTYVHSNGIHQLPTSFCRCSDSPAPDIQLLRMGLFLSTSKDLQTAFAFALLDDYILEKLECKTSTAHYYSKLWRMTSNAFLHTVKVCAKDRFDPLDFHCFILGSLLGASQGKPTMAWPERVQMVWLWASKLFTYDWQARPVLHGLPAAWSQSSGQLAGGPWDLGIFTGLCPWWKLYL